MLGRKIEGGTANAGARVGRHGLAAVEGKPG
jgi:hypothetical protein